MINKVLLLLSLVSFSACQISTQQARKPIVFQPISQTDIAQAVLYEANIRQYSSEGTFNAFVKDLPLLKTMGVKILWLMPINPISRIKSKGPLGSYYAVSSYNKVNPEFGTLDAQVSYRVPEWKSIFKVGASNLLNDYYTTSLGNPSIGGIYYIQITFDEFFR